MLTEEQIQRLAKKLADEHGVDEEQYKGYVRFVDNFSEIVSAFLPEDKKEVFKKALEEGFFEDYIQRCFSVGKEIVKIGWLFNHRITSTELKLVLSKRQ